jgi:hypothetical protein
MIELDQVLDEMILAMTLDKEDGQRMAAAEIKELLKSWSESSIRVFGRLDGYATMGKESNA